MSVYLPLVGGDGPHRKEPVPGTPWAMPKYQGVSPAVDGDESVGLRLDDYIVVDCDSWEAAQTWLAHIGQLISHTWVRKTPRGIHFYYRRTTRNVDVVAHDPTYIHDKINLKLGKASYVVFHGNGYDNLTVPENIIAFDASWVKAPEKVVIVDDWAEMPDGIGDNAMTAFAGTFRRWGMDEATILECLKAINKQTMTREPMPTRSLRRIAKSIGAKNPEEQREIMCPKCGSEVTIV
jgi:Primase C terminal 1 (PriCT-1)